MDQAPDHWVGRVLHERYCIMARLGEGGMGAVYRGEHQAIRRPVAIKVLNPMLAASPDFAKRFEREALAAGRLSHPNCVPVTDFGRLEDGTTYLVMELVDGRTLAELIAADAPLHPVRALRIARHVLRGIGHAHASNIMHRDIKPDNVMVEAHADDPDFARVLDFGIAKLREGDPNDAITQAGTAVGTPTYLSPEQAVGGQIDHRCDLYSTSVLLFEMLTGKPPYTGGNPLKVLTQHATAPIPRLRDALEGLGDFPDLDALVYKGLAKEAEDRYQSAEEFVAAIDTCLMSLGEHFTPAPAMLHTPIPFAAHTPAPAMLHTPIPFAAHTPAPPQTYATGGTALGPATIAPDHVMTQATLETAPTRRPKRGPVAWLWIAISLAAIIGVLSVGLSKSGDAGVASLVLEPLLEELERGKTCEDRRDAVDKLRHLRDKRAIPALKKARRRMRGGIVGIGQKNTNRCLTELADKAIAELEAL